MTDVMRGSLADRRNAPETGERVDTLVQFRNLSIAHILGRVVAPTAYLQTEDEFALVLEGGATLDVLGERIELVSGDWVLLQAGVPHQVVTSEPGTSWLTVKLGPDSPVSGART